MIIITARASVRPDQRDAAISAAHEMRKLTLDEPGCIDYRFWNATDAPDVFLVLEQWEGQTALDIHLAAPHTTAFLTDIAPAVEEAIEVTRFEVSNHGPLFEP